MYKDYFSFRYYVAIHLFEIKEKNSKLIFHKITHLTKKLLQWKVNCFKTYITLWLVSFEDRYYSSKDLEMMKMKK